MSIASTVHEEARISPVALPLHWLELHGDALYAFAVRRVRRAEVAEDLVQETLLAALQSVDRFGHRAQIRTWLIGILKNKINDHLRVRYRHERLVWPEEDELFDHRGHWKVRVHNWSADPRALVEQKEFRAVIDSCMSKLPPRMAHLFLRRLDGQSTLELCQELGLSTDNAWILLHRARLRLRQCLAVRWFKAE